MPTKLKLFSYTLYSTRKLICELEHHRSHKKEVHLFKKSWKFMGCCTILGTIHHVLVPPDYFIVSHSQTRPVNKGGSGVLQAETALRASSNITGVTLRASLNMNRCDRRQFM